MRPSVFIVGIFAAGLLAAGVYIALGSEGSVSFTMHEADFEEIDDVPTVPEPDTDPYANWVRPEGPLRIALQAGHWKAAEAPEELKRIRQNGAHAGGVSEWQANLKIAEETKRLLAPYDVVVDVLPATIPPAYWADAFVAIHADGNPDTTVSGYKAASPRRDRTGKADELKTLLEEEYAKIGLPYDPNVTRNMRGYYAFNARRYQHALHPMTPAAILETGFITNPSDRRLIWRSPEIPARAVADALIRFLGLQASPVLP